MWRKYFGVGCHVHGVDIEPACRAYANAETTIHIGNQADRNFWRTFRGAVPQVDIVIDDGGHEPEQQMVSLEELLPHLRPGGVYICEDVHGVGNRFAAFAQALADQLNAVRLQSPTDYSSECTPLQASVTSVHLYPFMVVIETRTTSLPTLSAPRHGTQWQPFL